MLGSCLVERVIKHVSVLSLTLFLLVKAPLLRQLEKFGNGTISQYFSAGGFLHADDTCSLASNIYTPKAQVDLIITTS